MAASKLCALPLTNVREVMRFRALEVNRSLPAFVLGTCLIREEPTPVVDLAGVLGVPSEARKHLVTVMVGERQVALAVEGVLGTTSVDPDEFHEATPLVCGDRELVAALAVLDSKLVYLLSCARLLPFDATELEEANVERARPISGGNSKS
jgi:purine-binding chemotaxis protein CheW